MQHEITMLNDFKSFIDADKYQNEEILTFPANFFKSKIIGQSDNSPQGKHFKLEQSWMRKIFESLALDS